MVTLQIILNAAMQWLLPWAFTSFGETCAGHACSQSSVSSSRTEALGYQRCSGIRETPHPTVQLGGSDHLPAPKPSIKLGWNPLVFCCFLISSCQNVLVLFKEGLKTQLFVGLSFKGIVPCLLQVLWRNICFQPEMWALCLLFLGRVITCGSSTEDKYIPSSPVLHNHSYCFLIECFRAEVVSDQCWFNY